MHKIDQLISELVSYGIKHHLVDFDDRDYVIHRLLEVFKKHELQWLDIDARELDAILSDMKKYVAERGLDEADTLTNEDLFDTKIMEILSPTPSIVCKLFQGKYIDSPQMALY